MITQIYLYQDIDAYSAQQMCEDMDAAALAESDIELVICGNGGEPEAAWSMIAKFDAFQGKKSISVVGKAYSAYASMCCYSDDVSAIDTTEFLVHRAAYPQQYETNPAYFDDATKGNLIRINNSMKKAYANKIDVPAFEAIAGMTLNDLFAITKKDEKGGEVFNRPDVFLTAQQAKKIGLIKSVTNITPAKKKQMMHETMLKAAARYVKPQAITSTTENSKKSNMTTLAELKAEHPELYALAIADGAKAEKGRVETWLVFEPIDPKAVAKGISGDSFPSPKEIAEFSLKASSPAVIAAMAKEAAAKADTDETPITDAGAKAKEEDEFLMKAGVKKPAEK